MDRYRSTPTDDHPSERLLESFLRDVEEQADVKMGVNELIRLLRQPVCTLSAVAASEALLAVLCCNSEPTEEQFQACAIPDLRDVPDLSPSGRAALKADINARSRHVRRGDHSGRQLEVEIRRRHEALRRGRKERDDLLGEFGRRLPRELSHQLRTGQSTWR